MFIEKKRTAVPVSRRLAQSKEKQNDKLNMVQKMKRLHEHDLVNGKYAQK
jgi:hypothetical protein